MRSATVREWLATLGLVRYAELLEHHRIDLDVLPDLTQRDLQDLAGRDRVGVVQAVQVHERAQVDLLLRCNLRQRLA